MWNDSESTSSLGDTILREGWQYKGKHSILASVRYTHGNQGNSLDFSPSDTTTERLLGDCKDFSQTRGKVSHSLKENQKEIWFFFTQKAPYVP